MSRYHASTEEYKPEVKDAQVWGRNCKAKTDGYFVLAARDVEKKTGQIKKRGVAFPLLFLLWLLPKSRISVSHQRNNLHRTM